MTLKDRIVADLTAAMKAKDADRLAVLRMLKAKMMEAEVAQRQTKGLGYVLDDPEAAAVIAAYAKQRRDSIEAYRQGGREDLAAKEEAELAVIQQYLPKQLTTDELRAIVGAAIKESGAASARDMGSVMKIVMPKVKGVSDGKVVNQIVKEMLGG